MEFFHFFQSRFLEVLNVFINKHSFKLLNVNISNRLLKAIINIIFFLLQSIKVNIDSVMLACVYLIFVYIPWLINFVYSFGKDPCSTNQRTHCFLFIRIFIVIQNLFHFYSGYINFIKKICPANVRYKEQLAMVRNSVFYLL
jgi:hypothetical protein